MKASQPMCPHSRTGTFDKSSASVGSSAFASKRKPGSSVWTTLIAAREVVCALAEEEADRDRRQLQANSHRGPTNALGLKLDQGQALRLGTRRANIDPAGAQHRVWLRVHGPELLAFTPPR